MFALVASALAAPVSFEDHLASAPLHLAATEAPSLSAAHHRTRKALGTTMLLGYGSSTVGLALVGGGIVGFGLSSQGGLDSLGTTLLSMGVVVGGTGLVVSGAVVGTVAAFKLAHDLRVLDRREPRGLVIRPTISGLSGTF